MIPRRLALGLVVLAAAPPLAAQQVRVRSTTTAQVIQLRPLVLDSTGFVAGSPESAIPLVEDVELSSWGFGVEGLRAYGLLRARAALGSGLVWPRSDDHFDALAAYLELERTQWRFRLGRQQHGSGLGLYGFDGGAVTWRPQPNLRLEAYGGRGLARGYDDPINSAAIRGLDPLIPDHGTLLMGLTGWIAPTAQSTASLTWQREVLDDLSGETAHRVAIDGRATLSRNWTVAASGDYDIGASALGKVRLDAMVRLPHNANASLALFRYRPTFDLSTIWGAFAPQAHHGISAAVTAPPMGAFTFSGGWTTRVYQKTTETTPFLVDVGTTAHILTVGATWTQGAWSATGGYHRTGGYGGQESSGDVRLVKNYERWWVALNGVAFQNTEYFRVARGMVLGLGAEGRVELTDRLTVMGQATRYAHTGTSGMDTPNWSQTRALLQIDWILGANADRVTGYR